MKLLQSVVIACLIALGASSLLQADPQLIATPPPATKEQKDEIIRLIEPHLKRAESGSRWWSVAHNGSVLLAAVLGASAALVLKVDFFKGKVYQNDAAALCAALASLLTVIDTSGGFNRKWIANRATRANLQELQIDLLAPAPSENPQIGEATRRLKEIVSNHNRTISGDADFPKTQATPAPSKK